MSADLIDGLVLLSLLQVKHVLGDFFLQTKRMLAGRDTYLHGGRVQHVAVHGGLSAVALLVFGMPVALAIVFVVIEAVAHYHIDWLKGVYSAKKGHGPADADFWRAFGVDQLLHQFTYIAMIAAWAVTA